MTEVVKILCFVQPIEGKQKYCEDYYTNVHVPLIARTLGNDPRWISYYQNRLIAQYDAFGGFQKASTRWRVVLLRGRQEEARADKANRPNNAELQSVIELDHPNFVGSLARMEARESIVWDRLTGQVALRKFLIAVPNASGDPEQRAALVAGILALAEDNRSCRLAIRNEILGEVETVKIGDAIVPSERYVAVPTFGDVLELWFDNRFEPQRFFGSEAVDLLLNYGDVVPEVFEVIETCGFDKR